MQRLHVVTENIKNWWQIITSYN